MKTLRFDDALFSKLYSIPGVCGDEGPIRDFVKKEFEKCKNIDKVEVDGIGNILGYIYKEGAKDTILVSTHMDTVGARIVKIHDDNVQGYVPGTLIFKSISLARDHLSGTKVRVHSRKGIVLGVVCNKGVHLRDAEILEDDLEYGLDKMVIDVGLDSVEKVLALGIEVGDPVSFEGEPVLIGETRITGPFIDNRSGVTNTITLSNNIDKSKLNTNVVFACTVHEESDLSGIKTLTNILKPNAVIVMDTTTCFQNDLEIEMGAPNIGEGPCIEIGTYANKKLITLAINLAESNKIPCQRDVITDLASGCTEAWPARWYGNGTPAITISWPTRYLHSAVEMADMEDISEALILVRHMLYGIEDGMKYF